jgi:hypothetical protein
VGSTSTSPGRWNSNSNSDGYSYSYRDSYRNGHAETYTIAKAAPDTRTSTMISAQTPSNEKEIHFKIRVL